jgi:hypothetical protein
VSGLGAPNSRTAWAKDRALLGSTPSAGPGAKTGAGAGRTRSAQLLMQPLLSALADRGARIGTNATYVPGRNRDIWDRTSSLLAYANRPIFHLNPEPRQHQLVSTGEPVGKPPSKPEGRKEDIATGSPSGLRSVSR